MNDYLSKLKSALRDNAPQVPTDAREQAISMAKEQYRLHRGADNTLDDELVILKSALHRSVPKAVPAAREQAISTAREQFDRHTKGNGTEKRHMDKATKFSTLYSYLRRFVIMYFSRPSLALVVGAALLTIGIASYQIADKTFQPFQDRMYSDDFDVSRTTAENGVASSAQLREFLSLVSPQSEMSATLSRSMNSEQSSLHAFEMMSAGSESGQSKYMRPDPYHDEARSGVRFAEFDSNSVKLVAEEPVSTFSIDVDTASYAFLRTMLRQGILPSKDSIRTEELVNYFDYDYAPSDTPEQPFATHVSLMPSPWNPTSIIMHIGIKAYELDLSNAPPANLVFLVDTSGSMGQPNKLPLLVRSFKLLLSNLRPDDRVAIVAYAGSAGVILEPTVVSQQKKILDSLENLHARGSTAGGEGIRLAYSLAEQHMVPDGVNRVILATDGDFNVGMTDTDELEEFITYKRSGGVYLSVLGFGQDNYNDDLMQHLAQSGNGNAAFIDTISEARKVLIQQLSSTLVTIAKDVKIQVEFNPALVSEYRLIGYETRMLEREDFRNDKVDAGEIGAGHSVTAIYELTPANMDTGLIAPSRYQNTDSNPSGEFENEFAYLRIRYKRPDARSSTLVSRPVTVDDYHEKVDSAPREVRFAVAVAGFGELLRGGKYTGDLRYEDIVNIAKDAFGDDRFGYRAEFVELVRSAQVAEPLEEMLEKRQNLEY